MDDTHSIASSGYRTVRISGSGHCERRFTSNKVVTGRYTLLTFLPKNLVLQFKKIVNLWFVGIAVLQLCQLPLSPENKWQCTTPVVLLLLFSMAKDAAISYRRYVHDKAINERPVLVWNGEKFVKRTYAELVVGQLILLKRDEIVPADCLLLAAGGSNTCHIEMSGVTGETDKIPRVSVRAAKSLRGCDLSNIASLLPRLQGEVQFSAPDISLLHFDGKLKLKGFPTAEKLTIDNFVYRGCAIFAVPWVVCLVLYTGKDTKLLLNSQQEPVKTTRVERLTNRIMIALVAVSIVLSIAMALCNQFAAEQMQEASFGVMWLTFVQIMRHFASIWVLVAMVVLRGVDLMRVRRSASRSDSEVLNCCICEDLGRVEFILMDKTGTLTEVDTEVRDFVFENEWFKPANSVTDCVEGVSGYDRMKELLQGDTVPGDLDSLLQALVVCNSLQRDDGTDVVFLSEERALVDTAKQFGYELLQKNTEMCILQVRGERRKFQVLVSHQVKGRLRTIVKREDWSHAVLFVKMNAESVISARKSASFFPALESYSLKLKVEELQHNGQSVIVYCQKRIKGEELHELTERLNLANRAIYSRESRCASICDWWEGKSKYLAMVGVRERVEPSTADTVRKLRDAGVGVWVASGDEPLATHLAAINAGLVPASLLCCVLDQASIPALRAKLRMSIRRLVLGQPGTREDAEHSSRRSSSYLELRSTYTIVVEESPKELQYDLATIRPYGMIVHGEALDLALRDQECKRLLSCLLFLAEGVMFCRMLPRQKAKVVRLIKENFRFRPVTMAVGDGNDDIAMLQEADVAVAIKRSRSRAVNNADVSLSYLHALPTLMLVQGRWYLQRYSKTAILFIYKNFLLTLALAGYCFSADFQPVGLIETERILLFEMVFTGVPILCLGLFDRDLRAGDLMQFPQLYRMRLTIFGWRWALVFGIISFTQYIAIFYCFTTNLHSALNSSGFTEDEETTEIAFYLVLIATILIQSSIEMCTQWKTHTISLLSCLLLLALYLPLRCSDALSLLVRCPALLVRVGFSTLAAAVPGYAIRIWQRLFDPFAFEEIRTTGGNVTCRRHDRVRDFTANLTRVYRYSASDNESEEADSFKLRRFSLTFHSDYVERAYRWAYIQERLSEFRIFYFFVAVLVLSSVIQAAVEGSSEGLIGVHAGAITIMVGMLGLTSWRLFQRRYVTLVLIAFSITLLLKCLAEGLFGYDCSVITAIYPIALFGVLNVDFVALAVFNVGNLILFAISRTAGMVSYDQHSGSYVIVMMTGYMLLLTGITVTAGTLGRRLIAADREEFRLSQQSAAEVQRCREILSCLLPEFVRSRVREGVRYIAESKGVVSVLFCDICDFDSIIAKMRPSEITEFLDDFFQRFDDLCAANGVVKIETVGKTYMACAGLKDSEGIKEKGCGHARSTIELALAILRMLETYYLPDGTRVHVKIGINTGPVVAGVVGYHKPQFSLVGDTVNTASRMCSTIEIPDTIQISEAVFGALEDRRGVVFTPHFLDYVKGKGSMHTYFVSELCKIGPGDALPQAESSDDMINSVSASTSDNDPPDRNTLHSQTREQAEPQSEEVISDQDLHKECAAANRSVAIAGSTTAAIVRSCMLLLRGFEYEFGDERTSVAVLATYFVLVLFSILSSTSAWKRSQYFHIITVLKIGACVGFIASEVTAPSHVEVSLFALEVALCLLEFVHCDGLMGRRAVLWSVLIVFAWGGVMRWAEERKGYVESLVLLAFFAAVNLYAQHWHIKRTRRYLRKKRIAATELSTTEDLLSHMLPAHILEKLKEDKNPTDSLPNVTVLFADIVGFTQWSSDKSPVDVVAMLSDLFTRFDRLCVCNKVYKVHTIGDCYVVMGFAGADVTQRDPGKECFQTLRTAFDMIDIINEVNKEKRSALNMRIGLHTGTVIGGITGTNIVRYDIYGSDVMLANKMESSGSAGRVNVSETTKLLLESFAPQQYRYEFNKEIEVKTIGITVKAYFVDHASIRKFTEPVESESDLVILQMTGDDNVRDRHEPRDLVPFIIQK